MFRSSYSLRSSRALRVVLPFFVGVLLAASIKPAAAQYSNDNDGDIVRVEEDWEVVVTSSDSNSTAPQISTAISPWGNVEGHYATFEINHQSAPQFESGGLHLQIWKSEDVVDTVCHGDDSVMDTQGETIRWTQRMRLMDGRLFFSIRNGTSTTWGTFGASGTMWRGVYTSIRSLAAYDPDISVENSGVTYGGNRVSKLVLKEVRRYRRDGQVLVDSTPRPVEH